MRLCTLAPISAGEAAHRDAGIFHGADLVRRAAGTTRNDRSRMAHAATRRRSLSRDKADHRLAHMLFHVSRGFLFRIAADLADHHDSVRIRVFIEHLDGIRM